ncbi:MAG TPA: response regulator [bacterium]|nr:response regulator [bacterium]
MHSNQAPEEAKSSVSAKVLVIDDEESILNLISDILTAEGYEVSCADNGEKGVDLAQKQAFDLIIVDIMMPGIDGIETIKRIRQFNTAVSILILTAYGKRKDAVVNAVRYGVFDYITKPFDVEYLLSLIKYVLHRAKFGKMPYLDTMRDFYWEKDVSQKDLLQKKWSDLHDQVTSSAKVLEQDRKRIERYYIHSIPMARAVKLYFEQLFSNKYLLIVIVCLMLGCFFGYLFNMMASSQSRFGDYVGSMKMQEHIAQQRDVRSDSVSLGDFYSVMKNIEQWMKKDVEQERKSMFKDATEDN